MLEEFINQTSLCRYIGLCLLLALVARLLHNKYDHGINSIPGPLLASLSNIWRLVLVIGRRPELKHIELHRKYGSVVRLGPTAVSVSDPAAIKVIYAINAGFVKVFYEAMQFSITVAHTHANTTLSHNSMLSKSPSPKMALPLKAYSVLQTRNTTQNYGEQYPARIP
jgi:hypothetical protein